MNVVLKRVQSSHTNAWLDLTRVGKSGASIRLGVFQILRKHLEGGGSKNSQNVLIYSTKTAYERGGGQKSLKMCLRNIWKPPNLKWRDTGWRKNFQKKNLTLHYFSNVSSTMHIHSTIYVYIFEWILFTHLPFFKINYANESSNSAILNI